MRIVYPLTFQNDYTELLYSLRSVERFIKKPYEVVIVGDLLPEWIINITHISLPDIPGKTVLSVRRKVLAALQYADDDIFFMNDDIYLLEPADKNFPYYSSGTLKGKGEAGAAQLLKQLTQLDKPVKYFGHYPCIYKKDFGQVLENFNADCLTKSAYCNFVDAESVEVSDCKLLYAKPPGYVREFIKERPSFSTGVLSLKLALSVLEELFPDKSNFEL